MTLISMGNEKLPNQKAVSIQYDRMSMRKQWLNTSNYRMKYQVRGVYQNQNKYPKEIFQQLRKVGHNCRNVSSGCYGKIN